jgi:hypothetical protein
MSGYNVQNPPLFKVRDPLSLLQGDIAQLESQIVTPHTATVNAAGNTTYSTEDLLSNTIIRTGCIADVTDTFPTATQIIESMERKLIAIRGQDVTVKAGDYMPLTVVNQSGFEVAFTTSVGVSGTFNTVPSQEARIGYIIVVSTNPAAVYVDQL